MIMKKKVSNKDLALISGNIANLYEEGVPLLNILDLLDELPLKKEYKILLKSMKKVIASGGTLQEAFETDSDLVPKFFISMIGIGEKTGKIIYVLKGLEMYYNKIQYIKSSIINASIYPLVLIGALILLGIFVVFFFIPNMSNIYVAMGKDIPQLFLKIISLKNDIRNNPIINLINFILCALVVPYLSIKIFFKKYINKIIEKIPIYNMLNEYIAIVLMSVVVNSGINISVGLEYCCEGQLSNKVNRSMKKINYDITNGKMLSQAMSETEIFSKHTLAHIKLGEEGGSLDKRLLLLEEDIFKKLSEKMNKITKLIQPVLIIFIGSILIFFIIKFIMPLLDIVLV